MTTTNKNMPLGANIVTDAMEKNKKRIEQAKKEKVNKSPVDSGKPATSTLDGPQPTVNNDASAETPTTSPKKETKGVVGAKGVKLQPVQAKLKPKLYAMHQKTITAVNAITDSNITSADIMRASVHLLSKMKADKILQAIKETAV